MLPTLTRRCARSPVCLKSKQSKVAPSDLTFPRRPPTLTISRTWTHYNTDSVTQLIPPAYPGAEPTTFTWPPYTRAETFTSYGLSRSTYTAEAHQAAKVGVQLDPRNYVLKEGEPLKLEVRVQTVADGPPPPLDPGGEEEKMTLVEGEVADRLIEEAGLIDAVGSAESMRERE